MVGDELPELVVDPFGAVGRPLEVVGVVGDHFPQEVGVRVGVGVGVQCSSVVRSGAVVVSWWPLLTVLADRVRVSPLSNTLSNDRLADRVHHHNNTRGSPHHHRITIRKEPQLTSKITGTLHHQTPEHRIHRTILTTGSSPRSVDTKVTPVVLRHLSQETDQLATLGSGGTSIDQASILQQVMDVHFALSSV